MAHLVVHDTTESHVPQFAATEPARPASGHTSNLELDAELACAALELVALTTGAVTTERAATGLVNRLKDFLAVDGVALGLMRRNGRSQLAAISGAAEINRGSEKSRAIEDTLAAAIHGDRASRVDGDESLNRMFPGAATIRCRLATQDGRPVGALLVWGSASRFDRALCERFLRFAAEPLASTFLLQQRAQAGFLGRALRGAVGTRRWLLWAVPTAICLGTMFLIPYRIACDCAAEPLTRRFVSAPFAGVFEKSLVRPGDVVAKGSLLGQMDGRELRIELAAITANYEQARKSYDVNLAGSKVAAAQIDKLELARLDQQRSLVEYRMANLAIKSPVAGYVIGGDLKRTEGAPLTIGQVLYEIAPLEQTVVEVAIEDNEIAQVQIGQAVSIRFDAYAGQTFFGRLVRIHPRSETRDARNVFIGEVELDDAAATLPTITLRPGMQGQARITIDGPSLAGGLCFRWWHTAATFLGL